MNTRTLDSALGVVLAGSVVVVLALGLVVLGATGALATHEEERTTDGFKAYTPGGEIPNPGDVMSVELYMTPAYMDWEGPLPADVEVRVDYKVYYTTTLSDCDTQDVFALGIDRGNNNTHTHYDEDMVQSLMASGDSLASPSDDPALMTSNEDWTHRQFSWIELASPEDWPQELIMHRGGIEDQSIVGTSECVEMPEPGWHRTFGMMNGTITDFHSDRDSVAIGGETLQVGDAFEIWEPSLWYPVCHCEESRQVGIELDPPPGPMTRGSEGGYIHPNGTMEAPYAEVNETGWLLYPDTEVSPDHVTADGIHFHDGFMELNGPIYYSAGHVEADGTIVTPGGDRIEPDESASPPPPPPSPTPTPGQDHDDSDVDTPTPTLDRDDGADDAVTPTPQADDGADGADVGDGDDSGVTPTPDQDDDSVGHTPTPADAPGPGPVVTLLALLAGGLIANRRR